MALQFKTRMLSLALKRNRLKWPTWMGKRKHLLLLKSSTAHKGAISLATQFSKLTKSLCRGNWGNCSGETFDEIAVK